MDFAPRAGRIHRSPPPTPHRGVMTFAFAGVLILSMLGPFLTFGDGAAMGEGSPVRQMLFLLLLGVLIVAAQPWVEPRRLLSVPLLIGLVLAWCWFSLAWAIEPAIALRRLILATVIIWSIFLAARELGYERSVLTVRGVLLGAMAVNYAAVLFWPETGMHTSNEIDEQSLIGDWRGIMMHKNLAGPVCVMTMFFFLFDARRINIWARATVVILAFVFLHQSGSKTSFGLGIAGVVVGFLFSRYSIRYRSILITVVMAVACAATIMSWIYKNPIVGNFTDSRSFTGRPLIWKVLTDYIAEHPLLGAGYSSFWAIGPNASVFRQATGWITAVSTGHNGYLDLAAQIGIPATIFAVVAALIVPLVRLFTSHATANQRGALLVSILFFCIGFNFTESSLFDRDAVMQVFLMLAIALTTVLTSARMRSPAPLNMPRRQPVRAAL